MSSDDFIAFSGNGGGNGGNNRKTNNYFGQQRNNQRFHAYPRDNNRKNWNRNPRNFDRNGGNNSGHRYNNRRFNQGGNNRNNYKKNTDPAAYFHPSMLEDPWQNINVRPINKVTNHNTNWRQEASDVEVPNSTADTAVVTDDAPDLDVTMTSNPSGEGENVE